MTKIPANDAINFIPDVFYAVSRRCKPSWVLHEQALAGWNITYVISGEALYTIDGKELCAKAGDLLCLPPGTLRSALSFHDRLMKCLSIDFLLKETAGESASLPFPRICHLGIRKDVMQSFQELMRAWIERPPGYSTRVRGLLLLILHRLMELTVFNIDSSAADPRIEKVSRYIALHYSEKLTVQDMADLVDLTTAYLGSLFKRETGFSVNQYLTRVRVKNAENLLRSGEYRVSEVAELCGFSDPFHFDRRFKEITGLAPSACIPKIPGARKEE